MVEGVWKDFEFKTANEKDFDKISAFLGKYYYRDEPITQMLGWSEKKARDTDLVIESVLGHGLTLYAEDRNTKEIVAVRVGYDSQKKIDLNEIFQSDDNLKIQELKNQLTQRAQHFIDERYPEEPYAFGFLSSVSTDYRGQGLATEIYVRSIRQFRQKGFKTARNFFSSKITMKIVMKLGYEELSRIYLGKLRFDNGNGKLVFPEADRDFYATFMAIRL